MAGQIRFPKQIERSRVSVKSQANRVFPTKSNEHKYLAQAVLRILYVSERIDAIFLNFCWSPSSTMTDKHVCRHSKTVNQVNDMCVA